MDSVSLSLPRLAWAAPEQAAAEQTSAAAFSPTRGCGTRMKSALGALSVSLRRGVIESGIGNAGAKLLALWSLWGVESLHQDKDWQGAACTAAAVAITVGLCATSAARAAHAWVDGDDGEPINADCPQRSARITLGAIGLGAAGAALLGGGPYAVLSAGAVLGAGLVCGDPRTPFSSARTARHALVAGAVGGCLAAVVLLDSGMTGYRLADLSTGDPRALAAKQFAAVVEAVVTEVLKDSLRSLGPSVDRKQVTLACIWWAALCALPFYAATTMGVSGVIGVRLKHAMSPGRYDEHVPGALVACVSDLVKCVATQLVILTHSHARVQAGTMSISWPRSRALHAATPRLLAIATRNQVYEALRNGTESTAAAIVSQLAYALWMVRDPINDCIERRIAEQEARPSAPQIVPLDLLAAAQRV